MNCYSILKITLTLFSLSLFSALSAGPINTEVGDVLFNPPENVRDAISVIRRSSETSDLAAHLSILATRLWESNRYEESKVVARLALEEWEGRKSMNRRHLHKLTFTMVGM